MGDPILYRTGWNRTVKVAAGVEYEIMLGPNKARRAVVLFSDVTNLVGFQFGSTNLATNDFVVHPMGSPIVLTFADFGEAICEPLYAFGIAGTALRATECMYL